MTWTYRRSGRAPRRESCLTHDLRRIMDAMLYVDRTGIP
jgi:hypothetical protein